MRKISSSWRGWLTIETRYLVSHRRPVFFTQALHAAPPSELRMDCDAAKFAAQNRGMAKKASGAIGGASSTSPQSEKPAEKLGRHGTPPSETRQKPSSLLDTRVVYCGDNLEQLAKLPDACVDLIYIESFAGPLKIRATGFAGRTFIFRRVKFLATANAGSGPPP